MSSHIHLAEDLQARQYGITAMVAGKGTDVVFVHGALGDYRQWESIADALQSRHHIVALSRRYHWPNPAPSDDVEYSYEGHRDDLLRYLWGGGAAVHLVGHSYGAGVALLAAVTEPRVVRTLTLIEPALHSLLPTDAVDRKGEPSGPPDGSRSGGPEPIDRRGGPSGPPDSLQAELSSRAAMRDDVVRLAREGDHASAARLMIDWTQGGPGGFSALPPGAQQVLLQNAITVGPTFSRAAPEVTPQQVAALKMPTLVARGERTRLYYRLITETVASALPYARIAEIAGAGHMSIVEQPGEIAELLRSFLSETGE